MSAVIADLVGRLRIGDPAGDGGLMLFPVFGADNHVTPEFVTLQEAIASHALMVTETSESGEVPLLKAHNRGRVGVLILDGEELVGAKQNRVLNTTVYIRPGQEVSIPVSCTEAGRWHYRSERFGDSGHVATQGIRLAANLSVTGSLRRDGHYRSNQERVWNEVSLLQQRHNSSSPTSAARDVYESRSDEMRLREAAFECLPDQTGVLVLWAGRVVGLDVVASDKAYARLHERLVRSYIFDAPWGPPVLVDRQKQVAEEWLAGLTRVESSRHESPGAGISHRFSGPGVVGAALAVDRTVLHAVAFAVQSGMKSAPDGSRYPGFFERRAQFPW